MPEGDTIYRTARALNRALAGKPIVYFDSGLAQIAQAHDQTPFTGQTVTQVESRGKWLLIHFADAAKAPATEQATERAGERGERILATHMLMSGSWHLYQPGDPWQDKDTNARILIEVADHQAVGFRIPVARIYTPHTLARDKKIPQHDRDVLHADFDPKAARRSPAGARRRLQPPTNWATPSFARTCLPASATSSNPRSASSSSSTPSAKSAASHAGRGSRSSRQRRSFSPPTSSKTLIA